MEDGFLLLPLLELVAVTGISIDVPESHAEPRDNEDDDGVVVWLGEEGLGSWISSADWKEVEEEEEKDETVPTNVGSPGGV